MKIGIVLASLFATVCAHAGYEGTPTVLVDPEDPSSGNWKLRVEADGLYLDYESGTLLIVR